MRRVSSFLISLPILLALSSAVAAAPKKPEIADIHGQIVGREAKVSFSIRNAFTPEMVEALKSGIEISFKTDVRVERVHHGWFNDALGDAEIQRSVRFDALSRVFRLHRGGKEELLPDLFTALNAMSTYDIHLPLSKEPIRGRPYRVRVRSRLDRVGLSDPLRTILFFSSLWDVETEWARGYLAVP